MAELHLGRLLGVGGFAKVVAIKLILPHLSKDKLFVDLFLNEGRIAAQLSHPNVCQVYELGEEDGQLFLAMEYLDGTPWDALGKQLRGHDRMLAIAAGVLGPACDGLHYAHELRDMTGQLTPVVHRDISPQNLFVTIDGICKVLDFGVSKMLTDGARTRTGVIKGKLPYMSPEQIRGEPLDPRSDVFAAGVVLWEALTGASLFDRATDFLIWKAVLDEPIPLVSAHRAYGDAVDRLVTRALERDRERRFPTIRAFADELRAVATAAGGIATASELAELVRARCAPELAERARAVASVISSRIEEDPGRTVRDAPISRAREPASEPDPAGEPEPSATMSVSLRERSHVIARPPRRWPIAVASGLVVAGVAITLAMWSRHASTTTPPGSDAGMTTPVAVASVPVDAAAQLAPADAAPIAIDAGARVRDPRAGSGMPTRGPHVGPAVGSGTPPPPSTASGFYSVDSRPYATIFIDGVRQDQTPLYRVPMRPGAHQIHAVLADGRERTFTVTIGAGNEVSSGMLTW